MRVAVWVGLGWLGLVVSTAVAARMPWAHLVPDVPVVVVAFVAMRDRARSAAQVALALGYAIDAMATAPAGLHQTALVACALAVWLVSGHLGGTGAIHFGLVTGFAQLSYHVLLVALLWLRNWAVGFVSWPAALLLPSAFFTAAVGMALWPRLEQLHRRMASRVRPGLQWR